MERLGKKAALFLIFAAGCASAPTNAADEIAPAKAEHADETTRCGSPESDLFGCTSAHCCARTGIDCGDPHCTCRVIVVSKPGDSQ